MISKDEKVELLRNVAELLYDTSKKNVCKEQIHNMLSRDTNDTLKLYKYRRFDAEGYHLDSLKTGIMWCSAPNDFNDPFDSKIGVSIQAAQQEIYKKEWETLNTVMEALLKVFNNELSIEDCDVDTKPILEKLFKNEKIMSALNDAKIIDKENKEECDKFVVKKLPSALEMMLIIAEDFDMSEIFKNAFNFAPQMISLYSDEDKLKLCKTDASLNTFAEIQGIDADGDEIDLMLALAEKYTDNKSEIEKFKGAFEDVQQQFETAINSMFFIGCLATISKNRLMWSHYSEDHKGFCIEYDFSEWDDVSFGGYLLPILYSQKRPQFPWEHIITKTPETKQEFIKELLIGLLTKDDIWEYENEWRILIPQNSGTIYKMPKISCVYLGEAISEENKRKVLEIAKDKHIPVKQIKMDRCEYDLHAIDIN